MTSAKARRQLPQPDLSYSLRFASNREWFAGPLFVLVGSFVSVEALLRSGDPRPDELPLPPNWIPPVVLVVGLVICYLALFRRVTRLEINNGTLYWFTAFRRLKGQAPVAEIATIWTSSAYEWPHTQSVLEFRNGRTVGVRDDRGIAAFVARLVAISPDIDTGDWKAHEPRQPRDRSYGSSYPSNGDY